MKLVLYLFILLGATLLSFDLAKEVKAIEVEPMPEPTKPVQPQVSAPTPQQAPNGHSEALKQLQDELAKCTADIEKAPDQSAPYAKRAEAYVQLRQYENAIADLDKASSISPKDADVYFQRAYILIATGKADEAVADFTKVLEIDPLHSKARLYRAIIHYRNKRFQPALDDCLALVKHDPNFYDAHITASRCYMELNNKAKAIEHLETYIANAKDPEGIKEARQLLQLWNEEPDTTTNPVTPGTDNE